MAFLQTSPLKPSMSSSSSSSSPVSQPRSSSILGPRSRKQLSLFIAGAAFVGLSTLITRRSLTRRYKASLPRFYQPSNRPHTQFNGAMEAFEALNIATINVASVAFMLTGGLLWAFDISSLEEMRARLRSALGVDGAAAGKDAEEEFEEWLATTLARRDGKRRSAAVKEREEEEEEETARRRTGR